MQLLTRLLLESPKKKGTESSSPVFGLAVADTPEFGSKITLKDTGVSRTSIAPGMDTADRVSMLTKVRKSR